VLHVGPHPFETPNKKSRTALHAVTPYGHRGRVRDRAVNAGAAAGSSPRGSGCGATSGGPSGAGGQLGDRGGAEALPTWPRREQLGDDHFPGPPAHVRDANKKLYEPRLVSIGPYYRGRAALLAMEQHKWRYLHELLAQYHPRASLSGCVRAVREVEHRARSCYSERTDIFAAAGDEFVEMLLLDGCFVRQTSYLRRRLRELVMQGLW
ncbi:unnamed protein product, partial [Urochloa humidicola]